ncbi:hypothetical protein ACFLY5_01305 [Patescibacteria group bacterium]
MTTSKTKVFLISHSGKAIKVVVCNNLDDETIKVDEYLRFSLHGFGEAHFEEKVGYTPTSSRKITDNHNPTKLEYLPKDIQKLFSLEETELKKLPNVEIEKV